MNNALLTRDNFRESVFKRDGYKCVMCGATAQDAHHILERRLFTDGGYYIDNGASLCGECHVKAEMTQLSVEEIREKCGIKDKVLPQHLYKDNIYTKWGDIVLENQMRSPGELFWDESVQKILKQGNMLSKYTIYVKYPRTFHCPWSSYIGKDDKIATDLSLFKQPIVITEKMDGENTTMYCDKVHARSIDGNSYWTQSRVRQLHSQIAYEIPKGWRICGENLFATHSIKYTNLKGFFYIFSIWNEKNECLSWNETVEWCELLEIPYVPVLYSGQWNEKPELIHKAIWNKNENEHEGYVIRIADKFKYSDFKTSVLKYVRANHVTSASHWKYRSDIDFNELA